MIKNTDNYQIYKDQLLGIGGFGCVYKGFSKSENKQIAIKMPKQYIKKQNKQQFEKQIRTFSELSKLIHPNLLRFYGFKHTQQQAFLFMQYCPNTLHKAIHQQQGLNQLQILKYFMQIVKGMSYINSKYIIHRDLKPDNILINQNNEIKITDFGLARMNMNDISKTTGLGTLIYMAPQILNHQQYTQSCDVWSLGAILYEMLTKKKLFINDKNIVKKQYEKFNNSEKRVKYDQNYHPFWEYFTNLMLTYNHKNRIKNGELLQQIKAVYKIMELDISNNTHNIRRNDKIIKLQKFMNYQKQKFEIYQKIINSYKSQDKSMQSPPNCVMRLLCLCLLLKKMKELIQQLNKKQIQVSEQDQLYIEDKVRQCQFEFYIKKHQLDLEITYKYYLGKVRNDIYQNVQEVINLIDPHVLTDFQKNVFNSGQFYRKQLIQILNELNFTPKLLSYGNQQFLSFLLRIIIVSKQQQIFPSQLYQQRNHANNYIQDILKGSKQQIIRRIISLLYNVDS